MEKTERLSTGTHQPTEGNAPNNTSFVPVCGVLPSSTRIVSLHKHKGVSMKSKPQVYFLLSLLAPFLLLLVAVGWMLLLSQSNTTHGTVFAALGVRHLGSTTSASHHDSTMQPPVNTDCTLIVPANPLTAQGLATPYQLIATDPQNGLCHESNKLQAAFVQGAIIDPVTGVISIYNPLVVDKGTQPAVLPQPPLGGQIPPTDVAALWFGSNGNTLTLQDSHGSLEQGQCVNGRDGSVFGQFAYCN